MKILVAGGGGYKGSVLVPKLLERGYEVTVLDLFWFGDYLPEHKKLLKIKNDVRAINSLELPTYDIVIHLASIANDPCSNLDPEMTWDISCQGSIEIMNFMVKSKSKRIIYASSGSVYGLKKERKVTEDLDLVPLTAYNKAKISAEKIISSYKEKINIQIIRPATVCGLAPRMRLDVAVNLLTMQAIIKNKITVLGGSQARPNIHIQDLSNIYLHFIDKPELKGIYNAGFENVSILELAKKIADRLNVQIEMMPSNDLRSYRLSSEKLLGTGFKPKYGIDDAIEEIIHAYQSGKLLDLPNYYNVSWMDKNIIASLRRAA
mgnify:CR=1 FL=1